MQRPAKRPGATIDFLARRLITTQGEGGMGIPQITDRMRTRPTQVMRAVFAGIGRILMSAERPQDKARPASGQPGAAGPALTDRQREEARAAESRWRSLDRTGNVRLLSAEDLDDAYFDFPGRPDAAEGPAAGPDASSPTTGVAAWGPAQPDLTELDLAEPVLPDAALAQAALAEAAPGEPALAEAVLAEAVLAEAALAEGTDPDPDAEPAVDLHQAAGLSAAGSADEAADLPLPSYDSLSLPSIRARLRTLNANQLRTLINYERTHAERPEVLGMFERRIDKLETGG